ncbi:MAG: DUF1583 domain-containing protein, partial [Planctomycetes bacterium]|nr:DUF1583 domain-containing protein [Planctomycetota bacterium]
ELTPLRSALKDEYLPVYELWPEVVAASQTSQSSELKEASKGLFDAVIEALNRRQSSEKRLPLQWETFVRYVHHRADQPTLESTSQSVVSRVTPKGEWTQVVRQKAAQRSEGLVPRWHQVGNEVRHFAGSGNNLLYFQSPLKGKFTVECELSTFSWRETRMFYGAQWTGPADKLDAVAHGNFFRNWSGPSIEPKLEPLGDWYKARIEVDSGKAIHYANDRKIFEQTLDDHFDPWLAIYSSGFQGGGIRGVKISGEPEIPAELALSSRSDLAGWSLDIYTGDVNENEKFWGKAGDEITFSKLNGWKGIARQTLLQYHRPMLEDGEITYDYYYAQDETDVSPALGRTAFLIQRDGVKLHWMTDAEFERTEME